MGYYLVRQNNETLLGPMNLKELSSKVSSMEVTMADEVTGNLGPWVFLESNVLEDFYPEIAHEVASSVTWHSETPTLLSKKFELKGQPGSEGSEIWKYIAAAMLLGVIALTSLIYKEDSKLRSREAVEKKNDNSNLDEKFMSQSTVFEKLEESFDKNSPADVEKLLSNFRLAEEYKRETDVFYRLLPYIRFAAFSSGGSVEKRSKTTYYNNIPNQVIVGFADSSLPKDCSLSAWSKAFNSANRAYGKVTLEKLIYRSSNLKALLWNAKWISARPGSGWFYPKNMHHACLINAEKVLRENIVTLFDKIAYSRVSFLLSKIEDANYTKKVSPSNIISAAKYLGWLNRSDDPIKAKRRLFLEFPHLAL
jgi:hypothetical protein